jgi:DNA replication protein DnaC
MAIERMNSEFWTEGIIRRYKSYPTDPQEVTWQCPEHGTIEPKGYEVDGVMHYSRQYCDCSIRERNQKEQEKRKAEMKEKQAKQTYSWLGDRWADMSLRKKTFDNFISERQPEASQFAQLFTQKASGTLILYGTFGTGKTHLLAAVCNEALAKYDRTSLFTTAPELFAAIQQYIAHNEDYYTLVEKATRTPLLVIDDIDKAKHTDFREEIYFAILDKRVNRGLPTAISTNRLDALAEFVGGAVCSRLKVGQIAIEMNGADYREEL